MTRTNTLWLDSRGFVRVKVNEHAEITLEDARADLEDLARLGGPGRCRALIDMCRIKSISKEAREHFRSCTSSVCFRLALVIGSSVGRVLGNFFFRHMTAGMPKKLFTDEDAAIDWLLEDS